MQYVSLHAESFNVARHTGVCRSEEDFKHSTFIIVGSDPTERKQVRLRDGDVIKLGRERLVVRVGVQERVKWFDQVHH
jgi:predicted component of type VI protein secretion system